MVAEPDWSNHTVKYKLKFHIMTHFLPELGNSETDVYHWYNETVGRLVSCALNSLLIESKVN